MFTFACHMFMHFSFIRTNFCLLIDIKCVWHFSVCSFFLSLSLSLSISCFIAPKCKSTPSRNPLRFKASFSSPLLILHPPMSSSVMIKPIRTFQRTFHDVAFIQNAKSFYWTFSILTFPLSSIVWVGSHCVAFDHLSLRDHTRVLLQYAQI